MTESQLFCSSFLVGIDDTDVLGAPGTNQIAKRIAGELADRYRCLRVTRHQLLVDPRVPYTSQNSSAALLLAPRRATPVGDQTQEQELFDEIAHYLVEMAAPGSDPGLCLLAGTNAAPQVVAFGRRCQSELCNQDQAQNAAIAGGLRLAGLGGTHDGLIGALAAIGLAAAGDDGRVVMLDGVDDLAGVCDIAKLRERNVEVLCQHTNRPIVDGAIDVGKHLRPNLRRGRVVLYAIPYEMESADSRQCMASTSVAPMWQALRLP